MRLRPCAFMNCRGDDDIDAKRSRPSIGKTRDGPREERTRAFVWDPISGLHQGQQPKRLHSKAEYMAAPERFAELSDFSLAPRAPSIHGPSRHFTVSLNLVASLIGRFGSSAFRLSTSAVSMSLAGSCFSSDSAPGPFHYGIRGRGGTIYWTALPSDGRQVQATKRTHLIHRPARDIIPPRGGARVFSYRM